MHRGPRHASTATRPIRGVTFSRPDQPSDAAPAAASPRNGSGFTVVLAVGSETESDVDIAVNTPKPMPKPVSARREARHPKRVVKTPVRFRDADGRPAAPTVLRGKKALLASSPFYRKASGLGVTRDVRVEKRPVSDSAEEAPFRETDFSKNQTPNGVDARRATPKHLQEARACNEDPVVDGSPPRVHPKRARLMRAAAEAYSDMPSTGDVKGRRMVRKRARVSSELGDDADSKDPLLYVPPQVNEHSQSDVDNYSSSEEDNEISLRGSEEAEERNSVRITKRRIETANRVEERNTVGSMNPSFGTFLWSLEEDRILMSFADEAGYITRWQEAVEKLSELGFNRSASACQKRRRRLMHKDAGTTEERVQRWSVGEDQALIELADRHPGAINWNVLSCEMNKRGHMRTSASCRKRRTKLKRWEQLRERHRLAARPLHSIAKFSAPHRARLQVPRGKTGKGDGFVLNVLAPGTETAVIKKSFRVETRNGNTRETENGLNKSSSQPLQAAAVLHPWTVEEDTALLEVVGNGARSLTWEQVARRLMENGFQRSGMACRSRYLRAHRPSNGIGLCRPVPHLSQEGRRGGDQPPPQSAPPLVILQEAGSLSPPRDPIPCQFSAEDATVAQMDRADAELRNVQTLGGPLSPQAKIAKPAAVTQMLERSVATRKRSCSTAHRTELISHSLPPKQGQFLSRPDVPSAGPFRKVEKKRKSPPSVQAQQSSEPRTPPYAPNSKSNPNVLNKPSPTISSSAPSAGKDLHISSSKKGTLPLSPVPPLPASQILKSMTLPIPTENSPGSGIQDQQDIPTPNTEKCVRNEGLLTTPRFLLGVNRARRLRVDPLETNDALIEKRIIEALPKCRENRSNRLETDAGNGYDLDVDLMTVTPDDEYRTDMAGLWSRREDSALVDAMLTYPESSWLEIAAIMKKHGYKRSFMGCRTRNVALRHIAKQSVRTGRFSNESSESLYPEVRLASRKGSGRTINERCDRSHLLGSSDSAVKVSIQNPQASMTRRKRGGPPPKAPPRPSSRLRSYRHFRGSPTLSFTAQLQMRAQSSEDRPVSHVPRSKAGKPVYRTSIPAKQGGDRVTVVEGAIGPKGSSHGSLRASRRHDITDSQDPNSARSGTEWKQQEIELLLDLVSSSAQNSEPEWNGIAEEMHRRGFRRCAAECKKRMDVMTSNLHLRHGRNLGSAENGHGKGDQVFPPPDSLFYDSLSDTGDSSLSDMSTCGALGEIPVIALPG